MDNRLLTRLALPKLPAFASAIGRQPGRWASCLAFTGLAIFWSCGPENPPVDAVAQQQPLKKQEFNWVEALGLMASKELQIEDVDSGEPNYLISDSEVIRTLLAAADQAVEPEPRLRCMAAFKLRFIIDEGRSEDLFVSCLGEPQAISGNQEFWQGMQAKLPPSFPRKTGLDHVGRMIPSQPFSGFMAASFQQGCPVA